MSLLLMTFYRCVIFAFLSVKSIRFPINSFDDLAESHHKMMLHQDDASQDFYRTSPKGSSIQRIYQEKIVDDVIYMKVTNPTFLE